MIHILDADDKIRIGVFPPAAFPAEGFFGEMHAE